MIKKYINLYAESFKLAIAFPQFVALFLFSNLHIFVDLFLRGHPYEFTIYPLAIIIRLFAMGGIGYVIVKLLRRGEVPPDIWSRGIIGNFWTMSKLLLLQMVILSITIFIPVFFLESRFLIPPIIQDFWSWINEFLFVFFIYEAIFWEEKGVLKSYRVRNVFMLARFEWVLIVFFVWKMPYIIVSILRLWGFQWLFSGVGIILTIAFLISLDWINHIFTFKVYGEDRIEAVQDVEKRVRESQLKLKEKLRKRRNR